MNLHTVLLPPLQCDRALISFLKQVFISYPQIGYMSLWVTWPQWSRDIIGHPNHILVDYLDFRLPQVLKMLNRFRQYAYDLVEMISQFLANRVNLNQTKSI